MIVNSHPYNPPSQQAKQQRCIGINPNSKHHKQLSSFCSSFSSRSSSSSPPLPATAAEALSRDKEALQEAEGKKDRQRRESKRGQLRGPELGKNQLTRQASEEAMQQQNSLYASNFDHGHESMGSKFQQTNRQCSQNVFDLMSTLHHSNQPEQHTHSSSLFDSAYGGDQQLSDEAMPSTTTTATSTSGHQRQQAAQTHNNTRQQSVSSTQMAGGQTDMSLYSPSSSTSLLYHIYDQINLPNDNGYAPSSANQQHQQQQQTRKGNPSGSSSQQLNAASLLLGVNNNGQQSAFGNSEQQTSKVTTIQQHELYAPQQLGAANLQHQFATSVNPMQPQSNYGLSEQQQALMFPNDYHHHQQQQRLHASTTSGRHLHNRPLSSQLHHASNQHPHLHLHQQQQVADQLMGLAQYGARSSNLVAPFRTMGKSHSSNLASVLMQHQQQQQHLGAHMAPSPPPLPPMIGAGSLGPQQSSSTVLDQLEQFASSTIGRLSGKQQQQLYTNTTTLASCSPVNFQQTSANNNNNNQNNNQNNNKPLASLSALHQIHHNHSNHSTCATGKHRNSKLPNNNRWKRVQQRARKLVYEYSTLFKCSFLFILLAFSLMSIIRFTVIQSTTTTTTTTSTSSAANNQLQKQLASNMNPLLFPPPIKRKYCPNFSSQIVAFLLFSHHFPSTFPPPLWMLIISHWPSVQCPLDTSPSHCVILLTFSFVVQQKCAKVAERLLSASSPHI